MKSITREEEILARQIVLKLWQLRIISTKECLKLITRAMRRPKKEEVEDDGDKQRQAQQVA